MQLPIYTVYIYIYKFIPLAALSLMYFDKLRLNNQNTLEDRVKGDM